MLSEKSCVLKSHLSPIHEDLAGMTPKYHPTEVGWAIPTLSQVGPCLGTAGEDHCGDGSAARCMVLLHTA